MYHYFKWVLPVTSLLTVLWVVALVTERHCRWLRLTVGACVIVVLLPWQAELRPVQDPAAAPYWNTEGQLLIPKGLPDLSDGVVFAAQGSWDDMFMGRSQLTSPAGDYAFNSDYKTMPAGGGLMLTPLRPLSPDLLTLEVRPPSLAVDRGIVPVAVRQVIVFGPPCWLRLRRNPPCQQ